MSLDRHPDLEIYIKNRTPDEISQWLENCCDRLITMKDSTTSREFQVFFGDAQIDCLLQLKVSGKMWSSLWFKSNQTPWLTDLDCALQASQEMSTQIRCIKAGWSDTDEDSDCEEDQWWKVEDQQQTLISWQG